MMKLAPMLLAATLLAGAAFAPVQAADGVATLRVDRGNVMASNGGEFVTANSGVRLVEGNRLMITEGSYATVIYSDRCVEQYATPGVYVIDATCNPAITASAVGGVAPMGSDWVAVGSIAAGVAVGAAILDNMDKTPGPPASR